MPKSTPDTATETVQTNPSPQTRTKWEVFEKTGLRPIQIVCEQYKPFHMVDMSCHSKLALNSIDQLATHIDGEHGGGYRMTFTRTDGKAWPGWKALAQQGWEAADVRCDICKKELPLHPQHLLNHLFKAHPGDTRRPMANAQLLITLTKDRPTVSDNDAFLDSDA